MWAHAVRAGRETARALQFLALRSSVIDQVELSGERCRHSEHDAARTLPELTLNAGAFASEAADPLDRAPLS